MTSELVGAVIPVRNRYRKIKRFLEYFRSQSYPNLRVYVVDSNSSDSTRDYLVALQDRSVVLIEASDNDFWAGATNRGVARALQDGCEYVLTINDDSVPISELVDRLVETARRTSYKIVGSRINYLQDPARIWSVGAFHVWGTHRLFQLRESDVYEDELVKRVDYAKGYATVEFMPGNGVLIHRSVFEKIGLYDEVHYPHYHADSEFILRAKKRGGFQAIVDYHAIVFNDVSVTGGSLDLLNRPITWWGRRFRLFFSRRSERRLLTLLHFLYHYCPPGRRSVTALMYLAHAVVHFHLPRVKRLILHAGQQYKRFNNRAFTVLSTPTAALSLLVASYRRWAILRRYRNS